MKPLLEGILLVDKPIGISSFGALAKVRGIWRDELRNHQESIKKAKIGHTGTLDPMASGLLILVLGAYTKRAQEFSKLDKVYQAELQLGAISTTADREGDITTVNPDVPTLAGISEVLARYTGTIMQTPPIYSAIKVDGQRAYRLARKGLPPKMEPRKTTIYSIEDVIYQYPSVRFRVRVSSGTYIRSLAQDIGGALGCGAYLNNLKRISVGNYQLKDAVTTEGLTYEGIARHLKRPLSNDH